MVSKPSFINHEKAIWNGNVALLRGVKRCKGIPPHIPKTTSRVGTYLQTLPSNSPHVAIYLAPKTTRDKNEVRTNPTVMRRIAMLTSCISFKR